MPEQEQPLQVEGEQQQVEDEHSLPLGYGPLVKDGQLLGNEQLRPLDNKLPLHLDSDRPLPDNVQLRLPDNELRPPLDRELPLLPDNGQPLLLGRLLGHWQLFSHLGEVPRLLQAGDRPIATGPSVGQEVGFSRSGL